jgi:fatty-acid peroxygenase
MFMSLMSPEGLQQLVDTTATQWRAHVKRWGNMKEVVLLHEVEEMLCRASCGWAGVPLSEAGSKQRTHEFAAMLEGAGSAGPRNWRG